MRNVNCLMIKTRSSTIVKDAVFAGLVEAINFSIAKYAVTIHNKCRDQTIPSYYAFINRHVPTTETEEPAQGNYFNIAETNHFRIFVFARHFKLNSISSVWRKCQGQTARYAWKIFTRQGYRPTYLRVVT